MPKKLVWWKRLLGIDVNRMVGMDPEVDGRVQDIAGKPKKNMGFIAQEVGRIPENHRELLGIKPPGPEGAAREQKARDDERARIVADRDKKRREHSRTPLSWKVGLFDDHGALTDFINALSVAEQKVLIQVTMLGPTSSIPRLQFTVWYARDFEAKGPIVLESNYETGQGCTHGTFAWFTLISRPECHVNRLAKIAGVQLPSDIDKWEPFMIYHKDLTAEEVELYFPEPIPEPEVTL